MVPSPLANWPGKASCDFTGSWGMKLSTNQQKSTYIKRSVSAQPELCISASYFWNQLLGHIEHTHTLTQTHSQEPSIPDTKHQRRTYKESREILSGCVSETIHLQMVFMSNMYPPGQGKLSYFIEALH